MVRKTPALLAAVAGLLTSIAFAPRAHAVCVPDVDYSGVIDINDFFAFLDLYANNNPRADINNNGSIDINDFFAFLTAYAAGCSTLDTDGDRLPDVFETNNGIYRGPGSTGTSPTNADTDADGLRDGDEVLGTVAGLDLPGLGCSPLRKNILIECDWQNDSFGGTAHSHRPSLGAINRVRTAFANAPVSNPYGAPTGITIIFDYGQGPAPFNRGNVITTFATEFISFDVQFNQIKAANFDANRKGYFHYSVYWHRYNSATNGSSGVAEINGDDFMVTLQTFLSDANVANTIVHELGHNLNLRHGGNVNTNYKPNYNSVMNYRYQFPGVDSDCNISPNGVLDYSRGTRRTLNENALIETDGICIGGPGIDWDGNGVISAGALSRNINCPSFGFQACGVLGSCADSTCGTLGDYNDWANIILNNLAGGDLVQPEIIECDNHPPHN